jgi:carbonic anhydrase/acetyltransferase-like protein (isoleucine patch superfamily)
MNKARIGKGSVVAAGAVVMEVGHGTECDHMKSLYARETLLRAITCAAAGAVVAEGFECPPYSLVAGCPAKVRPVTHRI